MKTYKLHIYFEYWASLYQKDYALTFFLKRQGVMDDTYILIG